MRALPAILATALLASPALAQTTPAGKDALDILTKGIAFQTVEKKGQVPAYAAFLKQRLVAAGYADADVVFTPVGETGYLSARLPGRDRKAKPTLLLGHMDVVAADPKDWTRDPFTAVVENGFVYGRGSLDNKGDVSIVVATLIKLKRAGWTPKRDVVLLLSGDEETMMETTKAAAKAWGNAGLVLNMDAGGGELDDAGKPMIYGLQAAEKTYADFGLTVTDPGGHSSRPTPGNPIMALNRALARSTRTNSRSRATASPAPISPPAPPRPGEPRPRTPRLRRRPDQRPGRGDARGIARISGAAAHHLRHHDGQRRPRHQRAAAARLCQHQLPHLPRHDPRDRAGEAHRTGRRPPRKDRTARGRLGRKPGVGTRPRR